MRTLLLFFAAVWLLPSNAAAAVDPTEADVRQVFAELRELKPMQRGVRYTLGAGGEKLSGRNDDFLRRRTAAEVRASGLTCGCGDNALVFIDRIKRRGYEALLVDSAQISLSSLMSTFSGHAVVAIRRGGHRPGSWWLVDSTARHVLSRNWSTREKSFSTLGGGLYWIGYCGPVEEYPVHSPAELREFYASTLATVPPEVFNRFLVRFKFRIDRSLLDERGHNRNPRTERMQAMQDEILARHRITPEREVAILLTLGGDDASGHLDYSVERGWVARIGLQSACSPSLLAYLNDKVNLRMTTGR